MKTKLTLTIIGTIMVLQAILYSAFASSSIDMMFSVGEEAATLAVLFQYAITPAFFDDWADAALLARHSVGIRQEIIAGGYHCLYPVVPVFLHYGQLSTHQNGDI